MGFVKPMLAHPMKQGFELEPGKYAAEEKYDGHRIICQVGDGTGNLFASKPITAWSRYGLERDLPTHLLEELSKLPDGIYDGELLVPGKRSYGVTELVNTPDLSYFVFDIIEFEGKDTTKYTYDDRRDFLMTRIQVPESGPVQLASSVPVHDMEQVMCLRDDVWARDGEGLILKRRDAHYSIGKRSKDFIKIKALRSEVLTVIGFAPSKGTIINRGPFATIILRDDEGNVTTVKTRNDAECRKLEQEAIVGQPHPAIGRKLSIEYQERTPDGKYRHPRFDHWVD